MAEHNYSMETQFRNQDDAYFAAKPADKCASILLDKSMTFYNVLKSNAYLDKLASMWRAYYGAYSNDYVSFNHKINFTGEQGELVQLPVNHFRNLAEHMYTLITSNRLIMECRAANSDYKSYAQTIIGNAVLEYYMREKKLEDALKRSAEMSIVLGTGFIKLAWNATAGDIYDNDPDTNEPIREGELEFSVLSPFDVVVDGTQENYNPSWVLARTFKNRFDLMAKYPELADKIQGIPPKTETTVYRLAMWSNDSTDDVPVYEFFHKPTESMPEGRYMLFLSAECVLMDAKMPYRRIPIFRITPSNILGTPYGYTPMFDIFPIQEAINASYSAIMTNQNAFAVQNIFVPRGADITFNNLEGALNVIEANAKPEALNLTQTPAEVFKYLEELIQAAETISGINSVARGNPEASLKSGTALALVQSQALQFLSGLQQSYIKLVEDVGTAVIEILKDFSTTPKMISLVGKNRRSQLKEFTGDKISEISRVIVDAGNPLSRSIAGRVQMAEQMMQMKIITNPTEYFQVIETGRIENMYEGEMDELLLIKRENEELIDGKNPLVSPLDKHSMHIQEHKVVLSDPDMRTDAVLVKNTMDHIEDHLNMLRTTDPSLLQMIGEQPLPPIQPPNPQPNQPNGPPPPQQPNVPQSALQSSPIGGELGQNQIQGTGGPPIHLPSPAKVPANLLHSPELQQQSMNNVKG